MEEKILTVLKDEIRFQNVIIWLKLSLNLQIKEFHFIVMAVSGNLPVQHFHFLTVFSIWKHIFFVKAFPESKYSLFCLVCIFLFLCTGRFYPLWVLFYTYFIFLFIFFFVASNNQILNWHNFACQIAKMSNFLNIVTYMTCNLVLPSMNVFMLFWIWIFQVLVIKRFINSPTICILHASFWMGSCSLLSVPIS